MVQFHEVVHRAPVARPTVQVSRRRSAERSGNPTALLLGAPLGLVGVISRDALAQPEVRPRGYARILRRAAHLGARPKVGASRRLQFHPHIHYLVPGGALSSADGTWQPASHGFYLPVHALSRVFRAKFRDVIAQTGLLDQVPPEVWSVDWNVNAQAVGDAANSLKNLSRYVFKVAISESRIQSVDDTHVCFTYRKVHSHRLRTMRLPIFAFIHRFLQHALPTGFMKVRYFGFLSPSFKMGFEEIRARIELAQGFNVRPPAVIEVPKAQLLRCPHCGAKLVYRRTILPHEKMRQRIAEIFARPGAPAMIQALNAGP